MKLLTTIMLFFFSILSFAQQNVFLQAENSTMPPPGAPGEGGGGVTPGGPASPIDQPEYIFFLLFLAVALIVFVAAHKNFRKQNFKQYL